MGVEAHAEDRGVAQHDPVGRGQPVHLGGDQVLHRVRQVGDRSGVVGRVDQRLEEQRVAARASGDGLDRRPRQRVRLGGDLEQPHRLRVAERREAEHAGGCGGSGPAQTALAVPPSRDHEPRLGGKALHEVGDQVRRRTVEEVCVVEQDDGRGGEQVVQELGDDLLDATLAELVAERPGAVVLRDGHVHRHAEERQPLEQVRGVVADPGGEPVPGRGLVGPRPDADQVAQQQPDRVVRRRHLELVARHRQHRQVLRHRADLVEQPGLAQSRLADDVEVAAPAAPCLVDGVREQPHLVAATHERPRDAVPDLGVPDHRPDVDGVHRPGLPLDGERRERAEPERRLGLLRHRRSGEHLAGLGPGHQPGGEVDGVALDGVRASERWPEVAGEHVAHVDAHAHRQPAGPLHDHARRPKHPLRIVAGARGCAGGEHDLAAVAVEVGLEERHLVVGHGVGDGADAVVERLGGRFGALLGEQAVGAGERHERDRDVPVLGLARSLQQVVADRDGEAAYDVLGPRLADDARDRLGQRRLTAQQPAHVPHRGAEEVRCEQRARRGAERDLPRARLCLDPRHGGDVRSADDELAVQRRVADQEEVERPAVQPDRHP